MIATEILSASKNRQAVIPSEHRSLFTRVKPHSHTPINILSEALKISMEMRETLSFRTNMTISAMFSAVPTEKEMSQDMSTTNFQTLSPKRFQTAAREQMIITTAKT